MKDHCNRSNDNHSECDLIPDNFPLIENGFYYRSKEGTCSKRNQSNRNIRDLDSIIKTEPVKSDDHSNHYQSPEIKTADLHVLLSDNQIDTYRNQCN
ncbi:MAG: hypothetical protein K0S44_2110 [Bacteroidetes bacterium]|nr:hypothetical protein [Bacteroidota bacterium]